MNTAVAPAKQDNSIRGWLRSQSMKDQIAQALPKHCSADRFLRVALTALTRTPKLGDCDQASFFKCLLDLSSVGLEPDGRRAHLIPFENRKRGVTECQLIIDYKGIAELVMRSGLVSNLHADVVCEEDEFDYDKGFITFHRINFKKPRGRPYAVYCICRFRDGTEKCDVMTLDDVAAIRARSKTGNNGPWVTDFAEMAKKTVFRRLSKWLPWSPEIRNALEADDDQVDDQPKLAAPSVLMAPGETRSDQLAAMLEAGPAEPERNGVHTERTREPGDDTPEPAHESIRLSDLALAIEAALHEPDLMSAANLAQKQQIIEALAEGKLTTAEARHLQRIVDENAARLANTKGK